MTEVALRIGGRIYRVACAPGEEDRVRSLGNTIDEKLTSIGNPAGPDSQNLLLAALLLADEVHEGRGNEPSDPATAGAPDHSARIAELEGELERLQRSARISDEELESARARQAELQQQLDVRTTAETDLREELARLRDANSSAAPASSGGEDMESLAPALESLAQMLEECADKLESRTTTP